MVRRRRTTKNSRKDSVVVWEALEHVRRDDRSPKQVAGYMKRKGRLMSHGLIYQNVRADKRRETSGHCRHGMRYSREAAHAARTAIRLLPPYRGDGLKTMTTDNGDGFPAHGKITEAMKGTAVCFADSCCSWQKGATKERRQTHKAIRAGKHGLRQLGQFFPRKKYGARHVQGQGRNSIPQRRNVISSNIFSDFILAN